MTRDEVREHIARLIGHGWNDDEIAESLPGPAGGASGLLELLVGVTRDLMTERTEE
jgi:hypothetical protein